MLGGAGVRVLTGLGSMGGSFQFSVARLGGGGGKFSTRDEMGLVCCSPGVYVDWIGTYADVYPIDAEGGGA